MTERSAASPLMASALDLLRRGSVYVILVIILAALAFSASEFFTVSNLTTVALQTSLIAIVGIGMTFAIITGGIDLSVGSVAALSGALAAGLATRHGLGTYPAIGLSLALGVLIGFVNGAMVVFGRIPPFVATLAMMAVARGLTLVYTQGRPIAGLDKAFTYWGTGKIGLLPVPVLVLMALALLAHWLLSQTVFGMHVYAVGGGEETARLASVDVRRTKLSVYVLSGFCAALAGIILTARLYSAQPNSGVLMELDAIAAAVLGGTSLAGGVGGIGGTIAGAFIIGALSNGLNLLEVPSYNQQVVKGLTFIVAVLLDYALKRQVTKRGSALS